MLENYLIFSITNTEYAASLLKVPIVLIAKKYIELSQLKDIDKIRLPFEGAAIRLIDIPKLLSLPTGKITLNSRLLVGQLEENFFGFVVDDVKEIIMIDESDVSYKKDPDSEAIQNEVNIEGRKLRILNIDKAVEISFEKEIKDQETQNNV